MQIGSPHLRLLSKHGMGEARQLKGANATELIVDFRIHEGVLRACPTLNSMQIFHTQKTWDTDSQICFTNQSMS